MLVAYLTHPYALKHEMGSHHPECPDRVRVVDDYLRAQGLLDFMREEIAAAAPPHTILRAHTREMVDSIERMAPQQGYCGIDGDTTMNPYTLLAAQHSAGAAVKAVDLVCAGDAPRAFCNIRPPGHHAERHRAMGLDRKSVV